MNYLPTCTSRLVVQHLYQVSFKSMQGCRRSWKDKLWCNRMTEWRSKQTQNAPLPFYGGGIKTPTSYFSIKVMVKVTRSLINFKMTLKSFVRTSLEEMHAKYEVLISYCSKFIAKAEVDNKQTDKLTDRQTDRTKKYAPDLLIRFQPSNLWCSPTSKMMCCQWCLSNL